MGFDTHALSGPQGGPSSGPGYCPIAPPNQPDPGTFARRWGGLVRRVVTLDGERVWTGEDGGRVRRGTAQYDAGLGQWTTDWSFARVPLPVRGIVRGLHMHSDGLRGWAVSSDGWVIQTIDGGQVWKLAERIPGASGLTEWEQLYDIFMAENGLDGWLVGHHGIWYTDSGGICWQPAALYDHRAGPMTAQYIQNRTMELYAIDVLTGGTFVDCDDPSDPSSFLGLVVGQPGFVFRSLDMGRNWVMAMHVADFCAIGIAPCSQSACVHGTSEPWIELWEVQISRNSANPIALIVGGVGTNCGLVYRSDDLGCSWEREFHECDGAAGDPSLDCTQAPEYDESLPPFRHRVFKTLYGVAIDSLDNTAIAAGYNGQHLRRDFLPGGTPIWRDRSSFANPNQWLANPSLDAPTGWVESARLVPWDNGGHPSQLYSGIAVAVAGNRVALGAHSATVNALGAGAVYIFEFNHGVWNPLTKVVAPKEVNNLRAGISLSMSGSRLLVGAQGNDEGILSSGAAYLYEATPDGYRFIQKFRSPDPQVSAFFSIVAYDDGTALIGAWNANVPCATGTCFDAGDAWFFEAPTFSEGFCFGVACPCGNPDPARGCANSGGSGANLVACGSGSLAADDLMLTADRLPPSQPVLLFAGSGPISGGQGVSFGDGLRCVGGGLVRLSTTQSNPAGRAFFGPGLAQLAPWPPAQPHHLQAWHRDPAPSPCGSSFNTTHALAIELGP